MARPRDSVPASKSQPIGQPIGMAWVSTNRVDPAVPAAPPRHQPSMSPPSGGIRGAGSGNDCESTVNSPPQALRKLGRLRKVGDAKPVVKKEKRRGGVAIVISSDDEKGSDDDNTASVALLQRVSTAAIEGKHLSDASESFTEDLSHSESMRCSALLAQLSPEVASAVRATRPSSEVLQRFVDLLSEAKAVHAKLAAAAAAGMIEGASSYEPVDSSCADEETSIWTPAMITRTFGWHIGGPLTKVLPGIEGRDAVRQELLALTRFQLVGVNWMWQLYRARINGILADDMGLGKTVQVCALLRVLCTQTPTSGPFLVVAPASTLGNWEAELRRWAPGLRVATFRTAGSDRLTFHHELMYGSKSARRDIVTLDVDGGDRRETTYSESGNDSADSSGSGNEESSEAEQDKPARASATAGDGVSAFSASAKGAPRAFDVLLTTYTLFDRSSESSRLDRGFLRRYRYQVVVLDEGL